MACSASSGVVGSVVSAASVLCEISFLRAGSCTWPWPSVAPPVGSSPPAVERASVARSYAFSSAFGSPAPAPAYEGTSTDAPATAPTARAVDQTRRARTLRRFSAGTASPDADGLCPCQRTWTPFGYGLDLSARVVPRQSAP